MQQALPLACFLSLIRPPGVRFEEGLLQILPVNKAKCPFVKNTDVNFLLYTRHNPTVPQELIIGDDEKLFASNIDFTDPTMVYFGAWMEQPDGGSGLMVRESYMLRGDTNVIMLDARSLEAGPWYFTAAENTWYIGNFAAQFIDYLVSRGLKLSNTHLVGHSLGAQTAGVAGSAIKSGRVSRITGLDPALPLFDKLPQPQRLDSTDAEFVDVIHTDAGIFGFKQAIGHADFFPNGGISPQPGCELEVVLHQQQITPKCDGRTALGFYTFHMKDNAQKSFKTKIIEFFTQIHNIKQNNEKLLKKTNYDSTTKQSVPKTTFINNKNTKQQPDNDNIEETNNNQHNNMKSNIQKQGETETDDTQNANIKNDLNTVDIRSNIDSHKNINIDEVTTRNESNDSEYNIKAIEKNIKNNDNVRTHELNTKINIDNKTDTLYINKNDKQHVNVLKKHYNANKLKIHDTLKKPTKIMTIEIGSVIPKTNIQMDESKNTVEVVTTERNIARKKRVKRFISIFRSAESENNNFLLKILEFLMKNRKNVLPVVTVMREISTLVKSANGELNHLTKEQNNYIGSLPTAFPTAVYNLELGNDSKLKSFVKRLLGFGQGDKLTITGSG